MKTGTRKQVRRGRTGGLPHLQWFYSAFPKAQREPDWSLPRRTHSVRGAVSPQDSPPEALTLPCGSAWRSASREAIRLNEVTGWDPDPGLWPVTGRSVVPAPAVPPPCEGTVSIQRADPNQNPPEPSLGLSLQNQEDNRLRGFAAAARALISTMTFPCVQGCRGSESLPVLASWSSHSPQRRDLTPCPRAKRSTRVSPRLSAVSDAPKSHEKANCHPRADSFHSGT